MTELTGGNHAGGKPDLVFFYHPFCPHCQEAKPEVEKLSKFLKDKDAPVNLLVVNMSKTMKWANELGLRGVPTVRMY